MGRRRHPFIWKLASILLAFLFFAEATVFAQMRAIAAARPAFTRARPPAKTTWKPPSQETLLAQMRTALAAPSAGMFAESTVAPMVPTTPAAPPPAAISSAERVSLSSSEAEGDRESSRPSVSSDGRHVAFESKATSFVPRGNKTRDVFVRDRELGTTERVSVSSSGDEGDRESTRLAISGNGRFVAFQSKARTFYSNDRSRGWNIFVHDRTLGATSPVSVAPDGALGDLDSQKPSISADGRYVAFESKARNFLPVTPGEPPTDDDSSDGRSKKNKSKKGRSQKDKSKKDKSKDGKSNDDKSSDDKSSDDDSSGRGKGGKKRIFVHDSESGELSLVSLSTLGVEAERDASDAAISADGSVVAFVSKAANLVPGDTNQHRDVFVHDRESGETTRVSLAGDGAEADHNSSSPSLSADGRYVAFVSKATNLVPGDTNAAEDIFVHDRETGATVRVSVASDGSEATGSSREPSMNATGRFVAFASKSENLTAMDANRQQDIFVRDLSREITLLMSAASDGAGADKKSDAPAMSGDGSLIAFGSKARNLVPGDTNKKNDVFARDVGLNRPPVAVDDQAATTANDEVDIVVLSNDTDPDGDLLTVTEIVPGAGSVSSNPDGSVQYTPPAGFNGADTFVYTIEDGHGGSDTATVTVDVQSVNQPPSVDAGADQILQLPTSSASLDATVTDDGVPVPAPTVLWSQVSGPDTVTFTAPTSEDTDVSFPPDGVYVLRLSADDTEFVVNDDVSVTVLPISMVEVSVGDVTLVEGTGGLTDAVASVTLSVASTGTVTVEYVTFDGTALAGCDYQTRFGEVQFAPGVTTQEIRIPVVGDFAQESSETFTVRLGNALGADIVDDTGTVTINDDDASQTGGGSNGRPDPIASRTPANGSEGTGADPLLSWTATDPDSDPLVFDVYFGTSFELTGQVWTQFCPASSPDARSGASSAYDEAGDRLIVFGGDLGGGADSAETWVLANASGRGGEPNWSLINGGIDAGMGPSARARAAAAYDPGANRLIVHGGCTTDCTTSLDDTWVLTEANGLGGTPAWVALPSAPLARSSAASAYDASTNRFILFGGADDMGARADVWVLADANGIGAPAWQALTPVGDAPTPRSGASAAFDLVSNRLIVFGGRLVGDLVSNETWVLSEANGLSGIPTWTELQPNGILPAGRWGHLGGYDASANRVIIFGGSGAGYASDTNFVGSDVWVLAGANGLGRAPSWAELSPETPLPPTRLLGAGAYSASQSRLVVALGENNRLSPSRINDLWVLDDPVGRLPLVASEQNDTSFATSTPDISIPHYWRVVARDPTSASTGAETWTFQPNAAPEVDAGPASSVRLPNPVARRHRDRRQSSRYGPRPELGAHERSGLGKLHRPER